MPAYLLLTVLELNVHVAKRTDHLSLWAPPPTEAYLKIRKGCDQLLILLLIIDPANLRFTALLSDFLSVRLSGCEAEDCNVTAVVAASGELGAFL